MITINIERTKVKNMDVETKVVTLNDFDLLAKNQLPKRYLILNEEGDVCCYKSDKHIIVSSFEDDVIFDRAFTIGETASAFWFDQTFIPLIRKAGERLGKINKVKLETITI
jgi:hypothetical protein